MGLAKKQVDYVLHLGLTQMNRRHKETIGANIKKQLVPIMSSRECAKRLGISQEYVRQIEEEALWKIYMRMHQLVKEENEA